MLNFASAASMALSSLFIHSSPICLRTISITGACATLLNCASSSADGE